MPKYLNIICTKFAYGCKISCATSHEKRSIKWHDRFGRPLAFKAKIRDSTLSRVFIYQIFSCSSSESVSAVRPKRWNLRGGVATGIKFSTLVVIDDDLARRKQRVISSSWFSFSCFALSTFFCSFTIRIFFFPHLSCQSSDRCHRDAQHGFETIIDIVQGYQRIILFILDKLDYIEHQLFYLSRKRVAFGHITNRDAFRQWIKRTTKMGKVVR